MLTTTAKSQQFDHITTRHKTIRMLSQSKYPWKYAICGSAQGERREIWSKYEMQPIDDFVLWLQHFVPILVCAGLQWTVQLSASFAIFAGTKLIGWWSIGRDNKRSNEFGCANRCNWTLWQCDFIERCGHGTSTVARFNRDSSDCEREPPTNATKWIVCIFTSLQSTSRKPFLSQIIFDGNTAWARHESVDRWWIGIGYWCK